ncbi:MAG: DUF2335 domain-containing protein [Gammaproteobacteria bacterium]|nr:DUF2335 domain-containing protein [Gammaproteobacteria bacterium]
MTKNQEPQPDLPATDVIDEEIERLVGEVLPLEEGAQGAELAARIVTLVKHESFSGPLPHPQHLQAYDNIAPGTALRIVTMAEKQQNHNIDTESKLVKSDISDRRLGMVFGAGLFLLLILAAYYSGKNENDYLATLFLGAAVLNVIGIFVNGRK